MGDELIVRARQNCCRLCLAPDSECISIINGFASDKEPLSNKIYACVNIKIAKADNLSQKICHFCISYINSWQSFKNRCIASQKKQQIWLDNTLRNVQKQIDNIRASRQNDESFTLPQTTIHSSSTPNNNKKLLPIQIKEEPIFDDEERDETMKVDLDPTDFLARNDEDETEELKRLVANQNLTITKSSSNDGGPPILTSLGLTSVLPFNFLSTELGQDQSSNFNDSTDTGDITSNPNIDNDSGLIKTAACRVCKLRFSTRANARRHERNIHGRALLQNQSSTGGGISASSPSSSLNTTNFQSQQQHQQVQRSIIKPNIPTHNANGDPITPEMLGIYEYDKPEKYRHLFTERLLQFIEQHSEFLRQYQNLTCKCCSREYPTYKNFMAHMRKKYPKLPRNLCFKCLTPFETKAHFVSHVKRRNCINYFKLYLIDDTIPKRTPQILLAEKSRARDLLTNKVYECKICPKKFRLKLEFRSHVYDDHSEIQKKDVMPGHCAFCGLEIEDPVERKRHYNNMECIVYLRCGTCEEKFDTHTKFLDHVYSEHLPKHLSNNNNDDNNTITNPINFNQTLLKSENKLGGSLLIGGGQHHISTTLPQTTFHSRMPQSCKICGQHYNNYNNVLRHMESKHPDQLPQTYKCSMCNAGFPRLSNLREHMQDIHNTKMAKPKRDMGIYCRMCMEKFDQRQNWIIHQNSEHNRYVCCVCNFQSRDTDNFIEHIEQHPSLSTNRSSSGGGDNGSDSGNKSYTGRYDYVMKDLLSITNGSGAGGGGGNDGDDENDDQDINQAKRIKLDTTSSPNNNITLPAKAECKICHAIFNSNLGLSNHMRAHNAQQEAKRQALAAAQAARNGGINPLNNDLISKPLRNTQVLAVERRFRRMRCRLCQKRFSTKKIYRRHMLIEHQIRNVQFIHCAVCKAEFAHEKGLKVHMIKVHGKVLKDISEMNLQFECDVCSTVYRTEEQLMSHKKSVHNLNDEIDFLEQSEQDISLSGDINISGIKIDNKPNIVIPPNQSTNYWYQCRYCASNFDTNKKLAIHINCHDEFDSNDYSCKDCGNVYSGRKSLWVHRYKKHPLIPDPAPCEICRKTFFDRNMLEQHLIHSHKQKNMKNNNSNLAAANKLFVQQQQQLLLQQQQQRQQQQQQQQLQHQQQQQHQQNINDSHLLTEDDDNNDDEHDDDDESEIDGMGGTGNDDQHIIHVSGEDVQTVAALGGLPQVPCSVCGVKFSDQDLFTKHMQMHEMMLYTDNPLASMFDTEPEDPDTFLANRINENGDYMCDICPKTFPQLTALKVHRNWHFRSDGKQIPADPNTVWRSTAKKRKNPSATLKCQFCQSSFISANNLKRHIAELHRRELAPTTELPDIILEKPLECTKCSLKFQTNAEWVEHKLNDAKIGKPYAPFEWGCEICGKVVSRKERLIQHMTAHIKDNEPNGHNNNNNNNNNSSRTVSNSDEQNNDLTEERKPTISSSVDEGSIGGGIKSENGYDESDSDDSSSSSSSDSSSTNSNGNGEENRKKSTKKIAESVVDDDVEEKNKKLEEAKTILNSEDKDSDEDDDDDDDDDEDDIDENKTEMQIEDKKQQQQRGDNEDGEFDLNTDLSDGDDDNEEDFDADDDNDDDDEDDDEEDDPNDSGPHACDLCKLYFDTSKQLRKHVSTHFVNGPEDSSKASTSTVATGIVASATNSPIKLSEKLKDLPKSANNVNDEEKDDILIAEIKEEKNVKDEIKSQEIHDIDDDEDDDDDDDEDDDDDDDMINDLEVVKEEFVHDGYEEIEEDGEVIMVPPM